MIRCRVAICVVVAALALVSSAQPAAAQPFQTAGMKPLTEMSADDRYKGQDGGLYGSGKNEPPAEHRQASLRAAEKIRPLDAEGQPNATGKIGLVSIGMSNTTQEFSTFVRLANGDAAKSRDVVLVDGAQGAMEAWGWARPEMPLRPGMPNPWDVLDQRLKQAGVSAAQVQAIWLKQARANPRAQGEYPKHADEFKGHVVVILQKLKERFPNLQIVYLSSRIYAGYATTQLNPEPYAYESAFAVRDLIQSQIKGDAALNNDPAKGPVKSALLLWGPYLWANGETARTPDGLSWGRDDLGEDGTHPSRSGQRKVAEQLLNFFKTDPTAKTWFVGK